MGTVAIGGINLTNVQRVIYQSQCTRKGLDGVAIVSAIFAAEDVKGAAATFKKLVAERPPFAVDPSVNRPGDAATLQSQVPAIVSKVAEERPLCHNMINYVVANFAANVALAMYVINPLLYIYIYRYR
jgi:thiamine-phosphate diphosphorylase/hydroxyethylthiazole kinase